MRLYERLADLADCLRYEDAARLRDRIASLERVIDRLARLDRLRRLEACVLAPALEPGAFDGFFVAGGRRRSRRPRGSRARASTTGSQPRPRRRRRARRASPSTLDELLVLGSFLRRPPPELRVLPLDRDAILARLGAAARGGRLTCGGRREPGYRPAIRCSARTSSISSARMRATAPADVGCCAAHERLVPRSVSEATSGSQ